MAREFPIPVVPAQDDAATACEEAEPFALMVLGDSMLPEFEDRDIIIIDPTGVAKHGSYVFAQVNDEYTMRQLVLDGEGGWELQALNPFYPSQPIPNLECIHGVVVQRSKPGRRKEVKLYED